MRKVLRFLLWFVVIVVVLLLAGILLPAKMTVEQTVGMKSKPDVIYAWVNDIKTYDQWMPWNRIDPQMIKNYGPVTSGQGASYNWKSENSQVGEGSLSITETIPAKKVVTKLEFGGFKPSYGGWNISPSGDSSTVTWYMEMDNGNNPAYRWMCLLMKGMMKDQFRQGLDTLQHAINKSTLSSTP